MLALNRQNYYNQYVAAVPAADYLILAKTLMLQPISSN